MTQNVRFSHVFDQGKSIFPPLPDNLELLFVHPILSSSPSHLTNITKMNAFVPSSLTPSPLRNSAFSGTAVSRGQPATSTVAPARHVIVSEAYSLDKYTAMSKDPVPVTTSSQPSKWWVMYRDSLKERFNPFRAARDTETTVNMSDAAIAAVSTPYARILAVINAGGRGTGGDPDTMLNYEPYVTADRYMAKCVTNQYKTTACPGGVYSIRCTEGTTKGQAEDSRVAALASQFRMGHRSSVQKFGDFTEARRKAIIACAGCSYEEKLVDAYPMSARAVLRGGSESKGVCARYANPMTVEESYMADCVDKQSKFRSVPYGVYDVLCNDGGVKGMAEYTRVAAMSARFRANQLSDISKAQLKYDSAKYARDYYGHGCDYEEDLYNKYAAVSVSMRPDFARY